MKLFDFITCALSTTHQSDYYIVIRWSHFFAAIPSIFTGSPLEKWFLRSTHEELKIRMRVFASILSFVFVLVSLLVRWVHAESYHSVGTITMLTTSKWPSGLLRKDVFEFIQEYLLTLCPQYYHIFSRYPIISRTVSTIRNRFLEDLFEQIFPIYSTISKL